MKAFERSRKKKELVSRRSEKIQKHSGLTRKKIFQVSGVANVNNEK